jgi:hypothetical protein
MHDGRRVGPEPGGASEPARAAVGRESKEDVLTKATAGPGLCQVGSGRHRPCRRPAATSILGVRFCRRCAREQEEYFAVGEATRVPRGESGPTGGAQVRRENVTFADLRWTRQE